MKRVSLLLLAVLVSSTYSCKNGKKNSEEVTEEGNLKTETAPAFEILSDSTSVHFTAYKTTDKLPVGGEFKEVELSGNINGSSPVEVIDGLKFSIPVSSLFTNDATGTRDPKIKEFFFGVMKDTDMISGVFSSGEGDTCYVDLTLNGETKKFPLQYTVTEDNHIKFTGILNLEDYNAIEALNSLNEACKVLHTGPDGVSKTWSEVKIDASILLKEI